MYECSICCTVPWTLWGRNYVAIHNHVGMPVAAEAHERSKLMPDDWHSPLTTFIYTVCSRGFRKCKLYYWNKASHINRSVIGHEIAPLMSCCCSRYATWSCKVTESLPQSVQGSMPQTVLCNTVFACIVKRASISCSVCCLLNQFHTVSNSSYIFCCI